MLSTSQAISFHGMHCHTPKPASPSLEGQAAESPPCRLLRPCLFTCSLFHFFRPELWLADFLAFTVQAVHLLYPKSYQTSMEVQVKSTRAAAARAPDWT